MSGDDQTREQSGSAPDRPAVKFKSRAERARLIKEMLAKIEAKVAGNEMKATLADYIRLVQLQKELDDESPKEIRVTWVEPPRETTSGSEE